MTGVYAVYRQQGRPRVMAIEAESAIAAAKEYAYAYATTVMVDTYYDDIDLVVIDPDGVNRKFTAEIEMEPDIFVWASK